jgi:hypothetical protein
VAGAWASEMSEASSSLAIVAETPASRPIQQRRGHRRWWLLRQRERQRGCACKSPRIGPAASTSRTPATAAKQVRGRVAHDAGLAGEATSSVSGEWEVRGDARPETRFHRRTGMTSVVPWLVVSGSGRAEEQPAHRHRGSFALQAVAVLGTSAAGAIRDRGRPRVRRACLTALHVCLECWPRSQQPSRVGSLKARSRTSRRQR